jgi:uncharacterized protein YcbX
VTHVAALARYPVKACAAEALDASDVGVAGFPHDRSMAVVVGAEIVTQREHPVLATVRPTLDDASRRLTLDGPSGAGSVTGAVRLDGPTLRVTLFEEPVQVVAQDPALSEWFSDLLGRRAVLVAAPESTRRVSPGEVTGQTVLSDEGTVSLHSLASLAALNRLLTGRGEAAVPADRFRANIVVDGCPAHAEDGWDRVEVGGAALRFAQTNGRCVVTTVDQGAGRRAGPEPLRTLSQVRRAPSGGVLFGVYLALEQAGRVRVGDPVHGSGRSPH